jgi:MFS family permease
VTESGRAGFASLHHRNFRLYLIGQGVSQAGTWMQTVAMGWLVLHLTGRGELLGLVTAVQFIPTLVLGAFAGALADRLSRWRILQTTQVLAGLLATALGFMVVTDTIRVWSLFVFAASIGTVNSFDTPVRSSFVHEMVGPDDLTGAVGIASTTNNVSRIIGPAVAGGLIAWLGLSSCFFFNGISYLAAITAFLLMRRGEFIVTPAAAREKGQVRAGLRVVWADPRLRTPMLMTIVIGALAYENQVSLPLLAKYTFGGSAGSYGFLSSAMGIGSVLGGLAIARMGRATHRRIGYAAAFLGVAMLVGSVMPSMALMIVALLFVGAGSVAFITSNSATLQLTAPPQMRGRVMALYVTAIIGTTPFGGPIIGFVGQHVGARATYVTGGLACLITAAVGWRSLAASTEEAVSAAEDAIIERRALLGGEDLTSGKGSLPGPISTAED